jgi:hypothetical protein
MLTGRISVGLRADLLDDTSWLNFSASALSSSKCTLFAFKAAFFLAFVRSSFTGQLSTSSLRAVKLTFLLILALFKNLALFSREIMHQIQLGMLLEVLEFHESEVVLRMTLAS